ncbi:MAG: phytanoyl-CoA dioxygenase family protein [Acidimicrobiales bacterium]
MSTITTGDGQLIDDRHFVELDELGFTIVPEVIDRDLALSLRPAVQAALDREHEAYGDRSTKIPHLAVELLHYDPAFLDVLESDKMHEVFAGVLGESCILYCFNSAIMPPRRHTAACEIHTDQTFYIPGYTARVLMTLALDDFTEENGATYHYPGGHRLEQPPSADDFYAKAIRTTRRAGDAVFFDCRDWHAGAVNNTDVTRYAIGVQAARPFLKQRFDYPNWAMPEIEDRLSPRSRRFLGFDARPPASLDDYYLPPEERGYRA